MGVGQFSVLMASLCDKGIRFIPEARLTSFCYFFLLIVCVHTCLHACIRVFMCMYVQVCEWRSEDKFWCWLLPSILSETVFLIVLSCLWPVTWFCLPSHRESSGITDVYYNSGFRYVDSGDPNFGPYSCVTSALSTESSSHPSISAPNKLKTK